MCKTVNEYAQALADVTGEMSHASYSVYHTICKKYDARFLSLDAETQDAVEDIYDAIEREACDRSLILSRCARSVHLLADHWESMTLKTFDAILNIYEDEDERLVSESLEHLVSESLKASLDRFCMHGQVRRYSRSGRPYVVITQTCLIDLLKALTNECIANMVILLDANAHK